MYGIKKIDRRETAEERRKGNLGVKGGKL